MPRILPIGSFVLVVLLSMMGCQSESPSSVTATRFSVPASAESGQPHLYAEDDGPVWLSWVAPVGNDRHALRYATLHDTSWTEPRTVVRGNDWFVNWADVPSLRPLPDGRLAAHFLRSNGPSSLAYAVRITQTTSDGTWQRPVTPHDDGTETEHGFVSLLPWSQHRLLAVWLDGRKMAGKTGHGGEMTLRGAVLDSTGTVEQRARLDARTCECCPTAAVRTGEEALVAYRDRSENETRNIRLVRFDGQSWSEPTLLHDDGWRIAGCPVNGPALAASGKRVAAAWYTAPGGTPRVKVAFSNDGGRQFTTPVVVAEGTPKGRVDVVLLNNGNAVVSWLDRTDETAALRVRALSPEGPSGPSVTMATLGAASRGVGMPHLERHGASLYAAWTSPDDEGVQTARLSAEALR
ncbi:MAG: hypothetical protein ABEL51_13980 [Salinibacter sp.]